MPTRLSNNAGNSSAEEKFVQLFCDVFGAEKGQYVYLQYPFVDIYGKHRTIDFAIKTEADKIAFEIDGETWHNPTKVSKDKYIDDLLKQNSMVHNGWKVFRWTDSQLDKTPERVKDELVTFLGYTIIKSCGGFIMRITRTEYLNKLIAFKDKQLIKVVTGIRRCGKSVMLELIKQELTESGVSPMQFISINFEDMSYSHIEPS